MTLSRLVFTVVTFCSLVGFAQTKKIAEYDSGGMPRCVYPANKKIGGVLLYWQSYKQYKREVYAIPLERIKIESSLRYCSYWQRLSDKTFYLNLNNFLLKNGQTKVGSYTLPATILPAIEQIRHGGNVYREETTGAEYLAHHPMPSFEFADNDRLSRDYGMGFAAEVFNAFLNSKPKNRYFLAELRANVERHAEIPATDYKMLFAPGYMENPKESKVNAMLADLSAMGLPSKLFDVNCTDDLFTNSAKMKKQILGELSNGHDIIVGGASKGASEVMEALAQLQDVVDHPPVGYGRVRAVVLISATLRGSYLADWALQKPLVWIVEKALKFEARSSGIAADSILPGLRTQSHVFLNEHMQTWRDHLPQSPQYVAVVGTVNNYGYAPANWIHSIQKIFLDSHLFPTHASNDGLLEYPSNTLPDGWLQNYSEVTFDASHEIFDGSFDGLSLADQAQRRQVLGGLFATLIK